MKRLLSIGLILALALTALPAITLGDGVTLNVWTNMTGVVNETFAEVCREFTAETGINIDYAAPANDYEALMKTKMATEDLPDVFSTHGWSVIRYSSFLRPLNDQLWFGDISEVIIPLITDDDGNIFVLPVDIDIAGIVYNRDILAEVGVDVDDIVTWTDFAAVCELVKEAGYIPVYLGGKDDWTIGQFFDWVAPSFFVTNEAENDRDALIDGTFDWNKWGALADMFADWNQRGFLNVDAATSDYATCTTELGLGNVAFEFFGNYAIVDANKAGPANLGMMPIPAYFEGDTPTLIAGERLAMGVWKDSKHPEEALQFINFLARPEIMSKLASANGALAGFESVESDTGAVAGDFEKYADVRTFPYFDRIYLPNGMWNDLCATGLGILNGSMSTEAIVDYMRESYLEKMDLL
ncbi:MAG: ABC transporter substrate-binding protein [Clostridia bacterium]|nr:ABC transporter substrate-binding protein [Clostridia bacterium]